MSMYPVIASVLPMASLPLGDGILHRTDARLRHLLQKNYQVIPRLINRYNIGTERLETDTLQTFTRARLVTEDAQCDLKTLEIPDISN